MPIARLFGFEIRIHLSWALILAVIAVTVATQVGRVAPDSTSAVRWLIGGVVAAAFLLSALAHELGHAITARRAGFPGGPVVVYFFGGAASARTDARTPRDEIVTALAGPAVSIVLGLCLLVLTVIGEAVGSGPVQVIGRVALLVGGMNVLLGLANLLPAFPLDGGRVARGVVWSRTGDPAVGLQVAASIGRWLGMALGVVGIVLILLVDSVDGLMLALAGWFLVSSARTVARSGDVDALLEGLHVDDVMDRDVTSVAPGLTLDTFASQVLDGSSATTLPVVQGAELLGVVGATQVRRLRQNRWAETRAGDVMVGGDALPRMAPDTTLRAALDAFHRTGLDGLPVMEAGLLAGIVTRKAVAQAVSDRLQARGAAS
ncbi:MAG TPA: site-2 protease family protein [Candidatus Saccharimonadales bacterium]|nr:site-2 protease family protein [Candidatus Saccharimonadales bacterium]